MRAPTVRRTRYAVLVAALLLALGGWSATPAGGATGGPTPTPTSPTCAPGQVLTRLATPAVPNAAGHAEPGATPLPQGGSTRTLCLPPPVTPQVAPRVAPEHVVGGPRLAEAGVVTDLPPGIPAPPDMPFAAYVLADLDTGEILAAKEAHAWLLPASTLKTLAALVLIPALAPGTAVVGAPEDTKAEGTRVGIVVGGRYTVDDLFNALILLSANDAAYALARAYGGRAALLAEMNLTAQRLGAFDTVALDPSGLDADGQHSSAYDLALFGRAVMQLPDYRRRAVLPSATFPAGLVTPTGTTGPRTPTQGPPFQIANHNALLRSYPGIIGVKNGYTSKARNTYIEAAERGGRRLVIAELGSPEPQAHNTPALFDWGFAYAGKARAVGTLVAPGTAQRPPELGPGPIGAATSSAPETTLVVQTRTGSTDPAAAPTATPVEHVIGAWWSALPDAARWGLLALVALLLVGILLVARAVSRSRHRGAYQR